MAMDDHHPGPDMPPPDSDDDEGGGGDSLHMNIDPDLGLPLGGMVAGSGEGGAMDFGRDRPRYVPVMAQGDIIILGQNDRDGEHHAGGERAPRLPRGPGSTREIRPTWRVGPAL